MSETLSEHPEMLRVVSPAQVLRNFGVALKREKCSSFNASCAGVPVLRLVGKEEQARAGMVWRASRVSDQVDVFISHAWGVERWIKALGLYYYLNVNVALAAELTIWLVLLIWLVANNGLARIGGKNLLVPVLVYIPTATFFLVLFSAHHFKPALRLWLDKLCIHQTNENLKMLGMQSMLEIVRSSDRFCILWDETYFERLWCNAELATFCATHGGTKNVDVVPLWLPPWIITTMVLDVFCSSLTVHLVWPLQSIAKFWTSWLGNDLWVLCLAAPCIGITQKVVSYLPLLIPNSFALTDKIRQHRAMFEQLRNFNHAQAKCTVESDRRVLEEHIAALFPQHAFTSFDQFMNVNLVDAMKEKVGDAAMLARRAAFLVVLPLILTSSAMVLSCDRKLYAASAPAEILPTPFELDELTTCMLLNSVTYLVSALFVFPAKYPLVLQLMNRAMRVEHGLLQAVLVVLSIIAGFCWMGIAQGFSSGLMLYATTFGGIHVLAMLLYFTALGFFLWWLTWVRRVPIRTQSSYLAPICRKPVVHRRSRVWKRAFSEGSRSTSSKALRIINDGTIA